jgi:sigma-B regulation protein RsbU (phosphoserine phosphatase)
VQPEIPAHRPRRRALTAEEKYRLLLRISESISGTLDLDEILQHILDALGETVAYDAAGVFVLTREAPMVGRSQSHQVIAGMATRGFPPPRPQDDPMLTLGQGIIGHVIRTGEGIVAPDVRLDRYYVEGRPATLSEVAVPIVLQQRTIGALNLESDSLGAYSEDDVEVLRFFASASAISIEKAILHRQVIERRYIQGQLQIAHDVQSRLLPPRDLELAGYDIAGLSVPTFDIGGDYYDYIPLRDGRLGLVIADVAGKGIPAALIMATFRALLRTSARDTPPVSRVVDQVNQLLAESIGLPAFVTSVYGVLDPATGAFSYANCGHTSPLLLRAGGGVEQLPSSGPCLGVFEAAVYEPRDVVLEPGDLLVFYTDGVVELERDDGSEFGVERLSSLIQDVRDEAAAEIIRATAAATREFAGTDVYQDDFTLLVVRRDSPSRFP